MKYLIFTYGCQMNKSDSERISGLLKRIGFKPASKINEADLIIVNMCSVRQSAVDRILSLFKKFKKYKAQNPKLKIVLTGCILPSDKETFEKKFDLILNIKDLSKWPKFLKNLFKEEKIKWENLKPKDYFKIIPDYKNPLVAYVPISTGCNNFCSYCVVPFTRGSLICRPHQEILKEVKNLIKKKFKRIWLLGQNVNDYKSITKNKKIINFAKLIKKIDKIQGDFKFYFTSPHPKNFSDKLIKTLSNCKKFGKYLNLPVQSGDDEILKKMNRGYTISQYKRLVKKIRKKIPEIVLSTDIIVGFPGENKKQFQNTVKLLKEIKYDMAYIAQYSPRRGTSAFKLKDNVSTQEKKRREKILTEILKRTALEKNKKWLGKTTNVLVEEKRKNFFIGKNEQYKTVRIIKNPKIQNENLIGKIIKVKITNALEWALEGKII